VSYLRFTKMEGAGNDFVVVDATRDAFALDTAVIRQISDRHTGVGFDQLLVIEPPRTNGTDFYYRIFNADGNEVEQCGNGARCFVRYVHDKNLSKKTSIRVETACGIIEPRLESDGNITVDMGPPSFEPAAIPMKVPGRQRAYTITVDDQQVEIGAVSMGNPHAVQVVANTETAPVTEQGPKIETHPLFPQGANAGYMQIIDRQNIRLRVWERGVGETLACGTGACAAAVTGIEWALLEPQVRVHTRGGLLRVAWQGNDHNVLMTGPARTVFEGEIEIQGEQ
jgi:diaminopimelate epimerase